MIRTFQIAAVILAGVAAYFFWIESKDGAFVASVLAASCFFLSIRFQAKQRIDQRRAAEADDTLREDGPNG